MKKHQRSAQNNPAQAGKVAPGGIEMAVNHAMDNLRMARARMGLVGGMSLDAKRSSAWCEYGFKDELSFTDFYNLYRRGGIAHGAVEKIIGNCWKTAPWIIEGDEQDKAKDETAWEKGSKAVFNGGRFWKAFAEADRRRLVGRYSGLLIRLRDSGQWNEPVKRKGAAIVSLTPVWAGSLKPIKFDENKNSETYGDVTMWQYTESGVNGSGDSQRDIHPDRILIIGDYSADAIGFLEPAYNAFVSLEKVEGGSGESFLKNAARQLSVSFDKEVDLSNIAAMYGVSIDDLHTKFNDAARDINRGNDVMLINQGATVNPLVTAVADPTPTYDVNLQTASAALDIPAKILVGMQTGERASTEDQKYFNSRCQSRRGDLSFELHDVMAHLIRIGVIKPIGEYAVMWDDLTESTLSERLTSAKTMSEINQTSLGTGEIAFTRDEIRDVVGYDALDGDPLGEGDDGEKPDSTKQP